MIHQKHELKNHTHNMIGILLAGLLIGGLTGAVTMLFFAPQSGKDTRKQIQKKGIALRDRTTEMVEDSMAQVRSNVHKIAIEGREKLKELKQQGQDMTVDQLDRVSDVVNAGKHAVKNA
jgi:gas vesicle protein